MDTQTCGLRARAGGPTATSYNSQEVGKMEPTVAFSLETCRQPQSMWPQEGVGLAPGHPGHSPHLPTICTICGTQQTALGREPGSAGWVGGEREWGLTGNGSVGPRYSIPFARRSKTLSHHHTKWPRAGPGKGVLRSCWVLWPGEVVTNQRQ